MWFSFMFFPFAVLIPFVAITVLLRFVRLINQRGLNDPPGIRKSLSNLGIGKSGKLDRTVSNEAFEVFVYRLAAKRQGRLSPAQIVVESGLSMSEVEKRMVALVDNVHIFMEVQDSGLIIYEFPELFS